MIDITEIARSSEAERINRKVESSVESEERSRLEGLYESVWDTKELQRDFVVEGFLAPFCVVKRRSDGVRGSLEFQHCPRFYFNFLADDRG